MGVDIRGVRTKGQIDIGRTEVGGNIHLEWLDILWEDKHSGVTTL